MKRLMRCAAWLYPASWRRRYAGEFEALLEDARLNWTDFWDILRGALTMQMKIWSFGKVASAFGLMGLAVAAVVALRTPSVYMSTAVIRMAPTTGDADPVVRINQMEQKVLSRSSLSSLLIKGDLYKTERASKPLEDIVQDMRRHDITIQPLNQVGGAEAFSISFRYADAAKAQAAAQALTNRFLEGGNVEVLDPASLPQQPFKPNRPVWVLVGLLVGLAAGSIVFGIGKWPKVALTGLGAAFATLMVAYFIPDHFRSTAVLRAPDARTIQMVSQSIADPAFLRTVIQGPAQLYPGKPIDEAVQEMRNHGLRFQRMQVPGGRVANAFAISFEYADDTHEFELIGQHTSRYRTQMVVRDMVAHAMETAVADPGHPKLETLDPASLPEQPFRPNRQVLVVLGLLAGLMAGMFWQLRGRFRKPTLKHA